MFPCVIRVPRWVHNPRGVYHMYYAAHSGPEIHLAVSDRPEGPWEPMNEPVLSIESTPFPDHISSPHVFVDEKHKCFRLYYHGAYLPIPDRGIDREQPSAVTVSDDPHRFTQPTKIILTQGVNWGYLRVFRRDDAFYAVGRQGRLLRSGDGDCWEGGSYLLSWPKLADLRGRVFPAQLAGEDITGRTRHFAVDTGTPGDTMDLYFSQKTSDNEESLFKTRISLKGCWHGWGPVETPQEIMKPSQPLDVGKNGRKDLRDPFILRGKDRLYLYYAAGEERCLCLATAEIPIRKS